MTHEAREEPVYLLGHTDRELDRLDLQGRLYRDATERCLHDAGIARGDRILDVGCGSGDVSLLCAALVGDGGEVVGLDREPAAVARASARAAREGAHQARFVTSLDEPEVGDRPFDAIVGRFILMHQADPAHLLRTLLERLRPGGVVAFVESSMHLLLEGPHSYPHSALFEAVVRWKSAVVESAGADLASGSRLHQTFLDAGLPAPRLRLEARVAGGREHDALRFMAESVRSMRAQATAAGIANTLGPDDTLENRLAAELERTRGTITLWPTISGWTRKP